MIDAYRVSVLVRFIKELLESDLRLTNLWVEGEITNLSRSTRGHQYFTLKDGDSQLRCVMFQRAYRGEPLENGAQVLAHGNVSFYEQRGDVQLVVDFVQPAGVGARQAEFERLKEKLAAEGLFDEARKRPLRAFPKRIGVVTSPTGAVFHDISNVLARRWPLAEVVLAPTAVQGTTAATGIADAVAQLNSEAAIDAIIVARGGGSTEELWPFNEEVVARAIYASAIPVISAIGHETDFTIADFVADLRAPTPSAAAETVAPDRREVAREVQRLQFTVSLGARAAIDQRLAGVDRSLQRMERALPDISRQAERVVSLLKHAVNAAIRSLDPHATLARGYAVVHRREGKKAVTSVRQVKGRDRLDIYVRDGRFPAEVSRQYGF